MTRYEQELRKLFDGSDLMDRPQYSGRVCVGELGKDLRVRAEFFSAHVADQYDAIRLTVLNRKEGVVDRTLLQFKDVWGKKPVPSNPNFRSGVMPHLWDDHGDVDWYPAEVCPGQGKGPSKSTTGQDKVRKPFRQQGRQSGMLCRPRIFLCRR